LTLEDIQHIAEISTAYDLDFPDQMDEWSEKVYFPVRKAIASNDKTVIDYLYSCTGDTQFYLSTAVEDGTLDGQYPEAIVLYKKFCDEQGFKINSKVMMDKIAV